MLERNATGDLLFPIRSDPDRYFYAGHLSHLRQALLARSVYGQLIAAIFGPGGNLVEVVRRDLPSPPVFPDSGSFQEVDEDDFADYLQHQFGFSPGLIRIQEFCIRPEMFTVYHLPDMYREFLQNPNSPAIDEDQRAAFPRLIQEWLEQGQFVLEWGNDYWLDSTGRVVAS